MKYNVEDFRVLRMFKANKGVCEKGITIIRTYFDDRVIAYEIIFLR